MYSDFTPKFVRKFADTGLVMKTAFEEYDKCVKSGEFPAEEHCFKIDESVIRGIKEERGN